MSTYRSITISSKDGEVIMDANGMTVKGKSVLIENDPLEQFTDFLHTLQSKIDKLEKEVAELTRDRAIESDKLAPRLIELLNKSIKIETKVKEDEEKRNISNAESLECHLDKAITKIQDSIDLRQTCNFPTDDYKLVKNILMLLKNKGSL